MSSQTIKQFPDIPNHHTVTVRKIREHGIKKYEAKAYCNGSTSDGHMARATTENSAINILMERCGRHV